MFIISHRANLDGPDPSIENKPDSILTAIKHGFSVEVDLRLYNNKLYFGHDEPQYETSLDFLNENKKYLWIHCKDLDALEFCLERAFHCFWHNKDDYTLTNYRYVWAYPGKEVVGKLCIMVMPEWHWKPEEVILKRPFGVCTDYPFAYKDIINRK
jgi:hypothetical protein